MKQTDNIDKLFKDSLGNLEADVNPRVWENIQQHISAGAGSNASSAGILGSLMSKVIVGVVGTAAVITAVVMLNNTGDEKGTGNPVNVSVNTETPVKEQPVITSNNEKKENSPVVTNTNTNSTQVQNSTNPTADPAPVNVTNNVPNSDIKPEVEKPNTNTPSVTPNIQKQEKPAETTPTPTPELPKKPLLDMVILDYTAQGFAPAAFTFTNKGTGEVVSWDFGDNSETVSDASPNHLYEQPGEYVVTLTVRDATGTTQEQTKTIKVKKNPNAGDPIIPNSFTPNGDGINDEFKINDNVNMLGFNIVIQDKNGKIVCQWSGFDGYWDGRNLKGEICPPGTYIYVLKYDDKAGEKRQKIGTITIPNQR